MSSTGATISDDVITLILLRLPLKSIFRCRCVSKPWNSLISDPLFRKTYLAARPLASPSLIGFFQWFFNHLNENVTNTTIVSPEEVRDTKRILFLPASDPSCVLDPSVGELKIERGCVWEYNVIAGPSNGLIVVSGSSRSRDLRVCNPLTREVFDLPRLKDWRRESWMKSFVGFYSEDRVSMRNDGSDVGGSCCVPQRYKVVVANVGYYGVQRADRLLHVNIFCSERGSWRKACLRSCSSFEIMVHPCGSLGGGLFYWHCLRDKFIVFDPNRVRFTRPKKRARHSMDVQLPVIDKGNLWVIQWQGDGNYARWEFVPTLGCSSEQLLLSVHRSLDNQTFHVYALSKKVHEYSHRRVILKEKWSLRHVINVEKPDMFCTMPALHSPSFLHRGVPYLIALTPQNPDILYYMRGCRIMSCDMEIGKSVTVSLQDHPSTMGPVRFLPYIQPLWPASVRPSGSVIENDDDSPDGDW